MFSAVLTGVTVSAIIAEYAEGYVGKVLEKCASKTVGLWKKHKLNTFIKKEIENTISELNLQDCTRDIFLSNNKDYIPVKDGFIASILKMDPEKDKAWFVKAPPCIQCRVDDIRADFSMMLDTIREKLWKNRTFKKLAGDKMFQQYMLDEIGQIKGQLKDIIDRVDKLERELSNIKEQLDTRRFTVIENVADPVGNFVGRQDLLDAIDSKLGSNRILFLTGFGGIGKSELSKKYAKTFRDADPSRKAVWLSYDGSIRSTIANGVKFRDIDDRMFAEDIGMLFEAKLAALSYERDLLIIIDNYEWGLDVEDLLRLQCRTVITTRYERIPPQFNSLKVNSLPPESAWELIWISTPEDRKEWVEANRADIESILREIDYHTLTVSLIAGLIGSDTPVEDLNLRGRLFDVSEGEVFSIKDNESTYDSIKKQIRNLFRTYGLSKCQKDILRVMSILPTQGMPEKLFEDLSGFGQDSVTSLSRLNLVSRATVNMEEHVSIHPLIKELVLSDDRPSLAPEDGPCRTFVGRFSDWTIHMGKTMTALEVSVFEYLFRTVTEFILSERESCDTGVLIKALIGVSALCLSLGRYTECLELNLTALEVRTAAFPPGHPDILNSYDLVSTSYTRLGRLREALEYAEKALEIRREAQPPDYPKLITSYNNIGIMYMLSGRPQDALETMLRGLEVVDHVPSDEPKVGTLYCNIGWVYSELGRFQEGLDYRLRSLEYRRGCLPADHVDFAKSYNSLAESYRLLHRNEESLECALKANEIFASNLPPDHPELAESYSVLGTTYLVLERYEEALDCMMKGLEIRQKVLPPDHPKIAVMYENIGLTYYFMDRYGEAVDYWQRSLEIRVKAEFPEHDMIAKLCARMAESYVKMGDDEKALAISRRAVESEAHHLPEDDPNIAICRGILDGRAVSPGERSGFRISNNG